MNDLLQYIFQSYSFLVLPNESLTGKQWADKIKEAYDVSEPMNLRATQEVEKIKTISNKHGVFSLTI